MTAVVAVVVTLNVVAQTWLVNQVVKLSDFPLSSERVQPLNPFSFKKNNEK